MTTPRSGFAAALRAAFPHTLPVLTGFSCLGMAYGVLMAAKGYGPLYSTLMSAVAFCGSMQYVAITLLTIPFDPLSAFVMSLLVNARHLFYGLSMLPRYKGMGKLRNLLIYLLCDETFSIACTLQPPPQLEPKLFYAAISLLNYSYWVTATFVGGVLGSLLSAVPAGLDFVLTALFAVLFLEHWQTKANRPSALVGVGCAIACLLLFGTGGFIIPAMACIVAALLVGRKALWS